MKISVFTYSILLCILIWFANNVQAENIHFNNDVYQLNTSRYSAINKGYENEYIPQDNEKNIREKMIGIYYYPEIKDPIKFAQNADKEIEVKSTVVLLKFIANKKQQKALLSFLDAGEADGKAYFEHNIYKYEPHPSKGMMILRYAKRYFPSTNEEAEKIALEVKSLNDDLMEQLIISPIPPIVEKDIN